MFKILSFCCILESNGLLQIIGHLECIRVQRRLHRKRKVSDSKVFFDYFATRKSFSKGVLLGQNKRCEKRLSRRLWLREGLFKRTNIFL